MRTCGHIMEPKPKLKYIILGMCLLFYSFNAAANHRSLESIYNRIKIKAKRNQGYLFYTIRCHCWNECSGWFPVAFSLL